MIQCVIGREGSVGVESQLQGGGGVGFTDVAYQSQLLVEVDAAYLQLHASESLCQLLVDASQHVIGIAHPHKAVDGNCTVAVAPRRREYDPSASVGEVGESGFQTEYY